ncbi:MAG: MerC domain-containing protein [Candidatus Eisenbacteria bacterium]
MEQERTLGKRSRWDTLGISASVLCAIHCAVLPIALVLFPAVAWRMPIEDHLFHQLMAFVVGGFGAAAFLSGYRKHRRRPLLLLASIGIGAIFFGGFCRELLQTETHELERVSTLIGSAVLITAHMLNLRACRSCHHDHAH